MCEYAENPDWKGVNNAMYMSLNLNWLKEFLDNGIRFLKLNQMYVLEMINVQMNNTNFSCSGKLNHYV